MTDKTVKGMVDKRWSEDWVEYLFNIVSEVRMKQR